ncbi:spore cortex biosynthesis protein YabQ [Clostridium niameyense]|uniref:Spore cortex biosynthesis protein YabQ n=1 Tax=Clostridium niameyense TaxID=1622073 RepID=A0A6M0RCZ7_9CLOT|nr:spore cortex biosynthesis protein YabQ [Clostridium niameyense]NEZ47687.1 spore cortex biosynthesis protein YabQ [Clostridium niameyense]
MVISISKQVGLLIFSFISGILTGVFFDVYRVIRGSQNVNFIVKVIEDILFWCLAGILVFLFLLYNNYAFIGAYVYLWIAIGIYVYLIYISKHIINIIKNIIKYTSKFFRVTINIIIYPIKSILYKINK